MDLARLQCAIEKLRAYAPDSQLRAHTYLRTYPALLDLAGTDAFDPVTRFVQVASAAYGWMPRVLRLTSKSDVLAEAVRAMQDARQATSLRDTESLALAISACVHSLVGASKILHFANPEVFPIWDRNVEGFRRGCQPSQYDMTQPKHYLSYVQEVHALRQVPEFPAFQQSFNKQFSARLESIGITPYSRSLTGVRCIELAMFLLSHLPTDTE
jgi:hypothetical protein